ncbi:hypothetical protein P691DRAFT_755032 [Macrolepiota fuliginosa MF-IS2]|uniref:Uncharacterized protein n=1 Tax=Macrolepiota fuliginosa MF-IS2 TaxID=1400762 RepID=A0A9P5XNA4_9AGAR|nr:hypothetical protein P691DRAFT_755032 [Macrolepiota fuliginosa MF-IS2]
MADQNLNPPRNPYASLTAQSPPHMNWQNTWPMYAGGPSAVPSHTYAPYQPHYYHSIPPPPVVPNTIAQVAEKVPSPSPSPPPPPKYEHWDEALKEFLQNAGLIQALKGFECDMLVLNSEWERTKVPVALEKLIIALGSTRELRSSKGKEKAREPSSDMEQEPTEEHSMDDRKLNYVHLASGEKARTPTSINKEISAFLARNRARNDASNRAEFLLSLSEKRKRFQENDDTAGDNTISSCARTDARTIDREVQMKYDIAKNDEGPLRRTKKGNKEQPQPPPASQLASGGEPSGVVVPSNQDALPKHHPGVDDRLTNVEAHLAVRYVPSPPRTLWARLKFLEDHIVKLEKDYPPWAALHFNQPNRGWPPPPRATPIIVPPHLRSSESDTSGKTAVSGSQQTRQAPAPAGEGKKARNTKSSLQRAVLERLEVQQAMGENSGG